MAKKPEQKPPAPQYYPQIDFIKGLAIIGVIISHAGLTSLISQQDGFLTVQQAVPVFFILLGITSVISFGKMKGRSLSDYYSKNYLVRKIRRYFIPFLLITIFTLIFNNILNYYYSNITQFFLIKWLYLIPYGVLVPLGGAGDYFVSILLQFILIGPVMFWVYKRSPTLLLIVCIITELSFEVLAVYVIPYNNPCILCVFDWINLFYNRMIFRVLVLIALGFYIAQEFLDSGSVDLFAHKNRFILAMFPLSILFLFYYSTSQSPINRPEFNLQNPITAFYTVVIVILLLNYHSRILSVFNRIGQIPVVITNLGRASYHIFLFQMFYFSYFLRAVSMLISFEKIPGVFNFLIAGSLSVFLALVFSVAGGMCFYYLDRKLAISRTVR